MALRIIMEKKHRKKTIMKVMKLKRKMGKTARRSKKTTGTETGRRRRPGLRSASTETGRRTATTEGAVDC